MAEPLTPMAKPRKIVIFGLPFSPNVGDGVIADCLSFELPRQLPGADVQCIDLSGRTGVGMVVVRRGLALRVLGALPGFLRRQAVKVVLGRLLRRCRPLWESRVQGADLVLFGGGQILSDVDLNFPLKLAMAADIAAAARVPSAVVAAGVARNWSPQGKALFARLGQSDLRHVALRDPGSIENWQAQMPPSGLPAPVFCRDPGVLAAECYGLVDETGYGIAPAADAPIGIGISDPGELALHADRRTGGAEALVGFFCELILQLAAQGNRIRLFCNGAPEDAAFMAQIFADARLAPLRTAGQLDQAAAPRTGAELAAQIAGCRAIVAHRLHACIVAYALSRPFVGLGWDRKLDSFLASVDLPESIADTADGAASVAARLQQAQAHGIPAAAQARVRAECRAQLASLLAACGVAA